MDYLLGEADPLAAQLVPTELVELLGGDPDAEASSPGRYWRSPTAT